MPVDMEIRSQTGLELAVVTTVSYIGRQYRPKRALRSLSCNLCYRFAAFGFWQGHLT